MVFHHGKNQSFNNITHAHGPLIFASVGLIFAHVRFIFAHKPFIHVCSLWRGQFSASAGLIHI